MILSIIETIRGIKAVIIVMKNPITRAEILILGLISMRQEKRAMKGMKKMRRAI